MIPMEPDEKALIEYFQHLTDENMIKRLEKLKDVDSLDNWQMRRHELLQAFKDGLGPIDFPRSSDLAPVITGELKRDGYRVEKVIFQSLPGYYVPANLYIPSNLKGRAPVILGVCGHVYEGKAWPNYQRLYINLVKKGFLVFAFDPIEQGERHQFNYGRLKHPWFEGQMLLGHSYPHYQLALTGSSLGWMEVWDASRAIDYLLTRDEVDGSRIGITGHSGGGTRTVFTYLLEERIAAAAPTTYLGSFSREVPKVMARDGEQVVFNCLKEGLDLMDMAALFAPKPLLINAAMKDFSLYSAHTNAISLQKRYTGFTKQRKR